MEDFVRTKHINEEVSSVLVWGVCLCVQKLEVACFWIVFGEECFGLCSWFSFSFSKIFVVLCLMTKNQGSSCKHSGDEVWKWWKHRGFIKLVCRGIIISRIIVLGNKFILWGLCGLLCILLRLTVNTCIYRSSKWKLSYGFHKLSIVIIW